jgi:hypothetical protein
VQPGVAWKKHKLFVLNPIGKRYIMTETAIKLTSMDALTIALGEVQAERFISLIMREPFDYTRWQQALWEDKSVEEISQMAMAYRKSVSEPD